MVGQTANANDNPGSNPNSNHNTNLRPPAALDMGRRGGKTLMREMVRQSPLTC